MAPKQRSAKKRTPERLTAFIKVYLEPSEWAMLKEVAERSEFRNISAFARNSILTAIRNNQKQPNGSAA